MRPAAASDDDEPIPLLGLHGTPPDARSPGRSSPSTTSPTAAYDDGEEDESKRAGPSSSTPQKQKKRRRVRYPPRSSSSSSLHLHSLDMNPTNSIRKTLHLLLESPRSSSSAFTIHLVTNALIIFSAILTVLETLPFFHHVKSGVWFGLETTIVVIFSVEYAARCVAWSGEGWKSFWNWFTSFFAIIDLLAILPYYIEIALSADTTAFFRFSILRTFRLLRVFRPFRYSSTLLLTIEVMIISMRRSKHALLALSFFVSMALVVFSTLLYFAERGVWDDTLEVFVDDDGMKSAFESIPHAAWFVLVTITTVGYGEIIPRSFLGRLITVPLLLFGLLLIALPSFVLGREFAVVWEEMGVELFSSGSPERHGTNHHDAEEGQQPPAVVFDAGGSPEIPRRRLSEHQPTTTPMSALFGLHRTGRRRERNSSSVDLSAVVEEVRKEREDMRHLVEELREEVRELKALLVAGKKDDGGSASLIS